MNLLRIAVDIFRYVVFRYQNLMNESLEKKKKKAEEVLSHSSSVGQEAEESVRASPGPSVTGSRKRTTTPSGPRLASSRPVPPYLSCKASSSPRTVNREPPRHEDSFFDVLVLVESVQRDYFSYFTSVAKPSCRSLL